MVGSVQAADPRDGVPAWRLLPQIPGEDHTASLQPGKGSKLKIQSMVSTEVCHCRTIVKVKKLTTVSRGPSVNTEQ